jgi:multisubunit Na+/H+ antiporter MnhC subunit
MSSWQLANGSSSLGRQWKSKSCFLVGLFHIIFQQNSLKLQFGHMVVHRGVIIKELDDGKIETRKPDISHGKNM